MTPIAPKRRTLKDIAHMASGTALAQAAPLLATPVLARLFAPTQFAELGVFSAMLLGFSLVISGRYEMAVPLPESERDAEDVLVLSLLISALGSLALVIACGVAAWAFGDVLKDRWAITSVALFGLPVGVFFAAVSQSCGYWFTRTGQFKLVGRSRAAQGLVTAAAGITFGVLKVPSGLVLSLVIGSSVAAVWLALSLLARRPGLLDASATGLRRAAALHKHFPLVNGPHVALDMVRETGTLLAFGALFGPVATGYLSQSLRVLRAPMTLIGQAVAQVFFPNASRAHSQGRSIEALTRKTALGVFAVSLPIYLLVIAAGPWLFTLVLGPEWTQAGVYARILAPWLTFVLVISSLSMLPIIRGVQPQALVFNLAETTARLGGLVIGGRLFGTIGALVGVAASGLVIAVAQLAWYWRLSSDRRTPVEIAGPDSAVL